MSAQAGRKKAHGLGRSDRLHVTIAREIAVAIVTGGYKPGEILVGENAASQALGVSRAAYREAIRILIAKGLVESKPKMGTRVCPRSRWQLLDPDLLNWALENSPEPPFLRELFELRLTIEPRLAELAAERRSDEDLVRMQAALADMERHEPDSEAAEDADRRFHAALALAAGNELMAQLTSTISVSVGFIARAKRQTPEHRDSTDDHRLLMEAIRVADPSAAGAITSRIISRGLADLHLDR